jgi:hypothetical protein
MLNLFRINDPFRLVIIFLLLVGVRLYFLFNNLPISVYEIKWLLLGEKLNQNASLYIDIWDNTPPLPALLYSFIAKISANTLLFQHLFALLLVMIQAYIFNDVLLKKNIHGEKSYVPAFIYVCMMLSCTDFLSLSPLLISLLFLLLVLRNLFGLNEKAFDEDVFAIGIYLGLAVLCYLPNLLFLPFTFIVVSFFRTATIRQYMLIIFGLLMTVGVTILGYSWGGNLDGFLENFVFTFFEINTEANYLSTNSLVTLILFLATLLVIGIVKTYTSRAYINYQSLCQLIMILWVIVGFFTLIIGQTSISPHLFIIFIPSVVFFLTYFFLLFKRKWLAEIYFLIFMSVSIGMGYYSQHFFTFRLPYWFAQNAQPTFSNKKVLVIGSNFFFYRYNQLATPYLDWNLAQKHFANLDYYNTVITIHQIFEQDLPEIIIDEKKFVPTLFARIPLLADKYEAMGAGMYRLKNKKINY